MISASRVTGTSYLSTSPPTTTGPCRSSGYDRLTNRGPLNLALKLLSAAVLAGIVVDVAHDLLNARFHPFEGPIDDVMHAVYVPSMLLVILFGIALASAFVDAVRRRPQALGLAPFLAILGVEAAAMHFRWRDAGASSYWPLAPDFLGGAVVGCACVYVARPLLDLRRVRWLATALLFPFAAGGAECDLIWQFEGGSRGTSWLWQAPVVDLFATAYAFLFSALGSPLLPWNGLRTAGQPRDADGQGLSAGGGGAETLRTRSWPRGGADITRSDGDRPTPTPARCRRSRHILQDRLRPVQRRHGRLLSASLWHRLHRPACVRQLQGEGDERQGYVLRSGCCGKRRLHHR